MDIKENNYYAIAFRTLSTLEILTHNDNYNIIASMAQQVTESALKSVLELTVPSEESLLKSHNLISIYNEIVKAIPDFKADKFRLNTLNGYYSDVMHPGSNYEIVSMESAQECLDTMYTVLDSVNAFRTDNALDTFSFDRRTLNRYNPVVILYKYSLKYNIKSKEDLAEEMSRIKNLTGLSGDELLRYIMDNFI